MWMLLLTPFYGVAVMMLLFTEAMIRYYCIAFSILLITHYLFLRNRVQRNLPENQTNYAGFWTESYTPIFAPTLLGRVLARVEKNALLMVKGLEKRWHFVIVILLMVVLATTLVNRTQADARNPTYQEALSFMASDKTDQNQYVAGQYTCFEFAADFMKNALEAGYNCGIVIIYFSDGRSHALNCFNIVDKGLIYIEPQLDAVVTVTAGQSYWNGTQFEPDYDDTIIGYRIIWNDSSN
jgi:hypothetical protein